MIKLTIHTATYNRGYILGKAYESLKKQTNKKFEWIITDDGSTDNTEELIKEWMKNENGFSIRYNKLKHVGVPRALNYGVSTAKTEWFMTLDSDDYILPNTVELVLKWIDEIKDNSLIGGIGFARCFPDGRYMKDQVPKIDNLIGFVDASHIEREKYNLNMDMCEVHRTKLFREYPFQVWEGEEFAPEQLNFYQMALDGWKMRWRADKLYVCEYLKDGLTKDDRLVKNNPMGFAMMHNQNLIIHKNIKKKIYDAAYMIALCFYAKHLEYLQESNNKVITTIIFPIGILLGIRRKWQYAKLP